MPTNFAILGAGAWGTAIALVLAQHPDHHVRLWSARPEHAQELHNHRENVRLLPGVPIPLSVLLTVDLQVAVADANLLIFAIPTVHLRATLMQIAGALPRHVPVLSLAKGLENQTFLRPSEILRQTLEVDAVAVLSGPSHAEEVSRGLPTTVVAASDDMNLARWIQQQLTTERFRVYTNLDVVGVELAGALKNVIGIAAGIGEGLGFGDNSKAALLTRGLVEMRRFGVALGAEPQTFAGLAGMGDLITTCYSRHGRNRQVGVLLARGKKLKDILANMHMVAEGVYTTRSVHERAQKMGIAMPITAEVYRVLYEDKDPRSAVNDLMLRQPTSEIEESVMAENESLKFAYKEWAAICLALAQGKQSLLLRKGGIAEPNGDFRVEQTRFWLLPTYTHQQEADGLQGDAKPLLAEALAQRPPEHAIRLTHFAEVLGIYHLQALAPALLLSHLHLWSRSTVEKRFHYRTPGLFVLTVRVWQAAATIELPNSDYYQGCKTWVELERALPTAGATQVLPESAIDDLRQSLDMILNPTAFA